MKAQSREGLKRYLVRQSPRGSALRALVESHLSLSPVTLEVEELRDNAVRVDGVAVTAAHLAASLASGKREITCLTANSSAFFKAGQTVQVQIDPDGVATLVSR